MFCVFPSFPIQQHVGDQMVRQTREFTNWSSWRSSSYFIGTFQNQSHKTAPHITTWRLPSACEKEEIHCWDTAGLLLSAATFTYVNLKTSRKPILSLIRYVNWLDCLKEKVVMNPWVWVLLKKREDMGSSLLWETDRQK